MLLYGAGRDIELVGDISMGHGLVFSHQEDAPALGWQVGDGVAEVGQFLVGDNFFFEAVLLLGFWQAGFFHIVGELAGFAGQLAHGHGFGHLVEVGFGVFDIPLAGVFVGFQEGFLGHVVDIFGPVEKAPQIALQPRLITQEAFINP